MATSRDLTKERYWRRVIRQFEASGLGVRRFCQREGLSEHRLHWWRRTLRQRDQGQARGPRDAGKGRSVRSKRPVEHVGVRQRTGGSVRGRGSQVGDSAFLPLGLPLSIGGLIEVVHPRGHVIRVPAVFDPTALGRILATIDASAGASEGQ
jgi:hypothetical protein